MLRHRELRKTGTLRVLFVLMAVCGGLGAAGSSAAMADGFAVDSFTTAVVGENGSDFTTAGGHPFSAGADIRFATRPEPILGVPTNRAPVEAPRDVQTQLPPGFSGDPLAADHCVLSDVETKSQERSRCSMSAAVGIMKIDAFSDLYAPIYNVVPEDGFPAQFGFSTDGFTFMLYPTLRSDGDFGLDVTSVNSPDAEILSIDATFCSWGVIDNSVGAEYDFECRKQADAPPGTKPFLTNPATECTDVAPLTRLRVNSWRNPDRYVEKAFVSQLITDCDTLTFEPSVDIAPTTTAADAPTGLDVNMTFPQGDNAHGQAPPALKKAVVTLPEGMSINPSSAAGLGACADDQLNLKSKAPVTCPEDSKIGTVTATSPLLEKPISGAVYIRTQNSADPESGEMYRLGLVLEDKKRGISVRLPGQVRADKNTGRVVTTFDNNPELPVSNISLRLKDGARAPLVTPPSCGSKAIGTELSSWGRQKVNRSSEFGIDCAAGLGGFSPGFSSGTANPLAGGYSPFALQVTRPDGNQALDRISVTTPPGFAATLKSVATCSEASVAAAGDPGRSGKAEMASPSCPTSSQVGTTTIGAGAGPNPFYVKTGKVYLTGPYKGAPLSLTFIVPAVAGPFDLGVQVVRAALKVNPTNAQITAESDPIPQILKGVPLHVRDVRVDIDRPDFSFNPTNCQPMAVGGRVTGGSGAVADLGNRFQVGGCGALGFKPKMTVRLKGATKRGGNPALRTVVTMPTGGANIARASVALPHSAFLDQSHIRTICTRVQFAEGDGHGSNCPKGSVYGHVSAISPILGYTLEGNVYMRSSDNPLPDLVPVLEGPAWQPVAIVLAGRIDSKNGGLRTTFDSIPDAPVSSFVLDMQGGKKGLIENSRNLCRSTARATVGFTGHSGKRASLRPVVRPDCPKTKSTKKKHRRHKKQQHK